MQFDEDVSSASTATSVSPLSPLFGSTGKAVMDLHEQQDENQPVIDAFSLNDQAAHRNAADYNHDDEDDGLFVDQDYDVQHAMVHSSSHSSLHKRLPSTIYEESQTGAAAANSSNSEQSFMQTHGNDYGADATSHPLTRSNASSSSLTNHALLHHNYAAASANDKSNGMNRTSSFHSTQELEQELLMHSNSHQSLAKQSPPLSPLRRTSRSASFDSNNNSNNTSHHQTHSHHHYIPYFASTKLWYQLSKQLLPLQTKTPLHAGTWLGFWALFFVTCANYVLTPLRDAIALRVGLEVLPLLTLASTAMAVTSSVPIGWLFEAPDPARRKWWKKMGLTRGHTQGTSLALFYRCFAWFLLVYGVLFCGMEQYMQVVKNDDADAASEQRLLDESQTQSFSSLPRWMSWDNVLAALYICFYLVVHLMKLHSLSLVWGVTTEAMEYEEVARKKMGFDSAKTRLQELALVGFGGTLGGVLGSVLASSMAHILQLPGLLLIAAILLELSAELSIELGRIMQKHWEEQQIFQSSNDLASLDPSMKRSVSLNSMKRISSGNSLSTQHMKRVASGNSLHRVQSNSELNQQPGARSSSPTLETFNDDSFFQRLLRGVTTILRSRLLMSIFTYNALYASTTVLLSFQRAALVSNRSSTKSTEADTAFLANVNMASSLAIFVLQATGLGAYVANWCGPRGTLSLMPIIRLLGVLALAWWHHISSGQPPNLLIFLFVDECCKIMNLAVAKPVRESLWRGLSNEARYEAKPIVDTLANRWGGGSAAFLVSFLSKCLDLFGVEPGPDGIRNLFGFPPIILLCLVIAAWWTAVSADLGLIRTRIDAELKKMQ
ncbi:hypothetical protein MPSEU_000867900 [Mayamaea pseudoterrestris]|nr:hypothetical protein MPSEU_000867900 [Mayamaea pseudoterrestris]